MLDFELLVILWGTVICAALAGAAAPRVAAAISNRRGNLSVTPLLCCQGPPGTSSVNIDLAIASGSSMVCAFVAAVATVQTLPLADSAWAHIPTAVPAVLSAATLCGVAAFFGRDALASWTVEALYGEAAESQQGHA